MIILSCNNLNKSFGVDSILENVSFTINEGDKVGTLEIYNGKKLEKTIDLVAQNDLNSFFGFLTNKNIIKYSLDEFLLLTKYF